MRSDRKLEPADEQTNWNISHEAEEDGSRSRKQTSGFSTSTNPEPVQHGGPAQHPLTQVDRLQHLRQNSRSTEKPAANGPGSVPVPVVCDIYCFLRESFIFS